MSICKGHEDTIIRELKRKGIYHLCAQDEHAVNRRTALWLQGKPQQHDFDPLLVIRLEIHAKAKRMLPGYSPVDHCPLCAARTLGADVDAIWISGFTDLTLKVAEQNHLPIRSTH